MSGWDPSRRRFLFFTRLEPARAAVGDVITVRFELLINGEIPAATLPDPLASGAVAVGAVLVVDDTTIPDLSQSILAFSTDALQT